MNVSLMNHRVGFVILALAASPFASTLPFVVAGHPFLSEIALADSRTASEEDARDQAKRLTDSLRKADTRDWEHLLDDASPSLWSDLTRTGRREALEALQHIASDDADTTSDRSLFPHERAIRYAAVNDAIYDRASEAAIVDLLMPALTRHLGVSRGSGNEERLVGRDILRAANGETFETLASFEEIYWKSVSTHWWGK